MIKIEFEISIAIDRLIFESEIGKIQTLEFKFLYSDNLHSKYMLSTKYPHDLLEVGMIAGKMDAHLYEVGYCLITKKGEIIAPFIVDLAGASNHLDQYDTFLKGWHIDRDMEEYCTEKLCVAGRSNTQFYKDFKKIGNGEKDFTHVSGGLKHFQ